jgi:hypothetical protein
MAAKPERQEQVMLAAELVRKAMQLLDAAGAPGDIAAHLDLAATRIDELADRQSVDRASALASPDAAQAR